MVLTKYLNETFPDTTVELLFSLTGKDRRAAWMIKYESMAEAEEFGNKCGGDKGFQALVNKWFDKEEKRGKSYWVDDMTTTYWQIQDV